MTTETMKPRKKAGRPRKYRKAFVAMMDEYFNIDAYKGDTAADFPTLAGFGLMIGVSKNMLQHWSSEKLESGAHRYPELVQAMERAKMAQEKILTINTLAGRYNPTFAGLLAANILDWRTRQDHVHSTEPDAPVVVKHEFSANAALARMQSILTNAPAEAQQQS